MRRRSLNLKIVTVFMISTIIITYTVTRRKATQPIHQPWLTSLNSLKATEHHTVSINLPTCTHIPVTTKYKFSNLPFINCRHDLAKVIHSTM